MTDFLYAVQSLYVITLKDHLEALLEFAVIFWKVVIRCHHNHFWKLNAVRMIAQSNITETVVWLYEKE